MLKKLVAVMILVSCASVVSAGEIVKGQTSLSLGLGGSLPMSDWGDLAETGLLAGFGVEYWISPQAAIGVEGNFHRLGFSTELKAEIEVLAGAPIPAGVTLNWNVVQASVYGKYLFSYASTAPYVKYSLGAYKLSAKISEGGTSVTVSDDSSDLGASGGLGVQFSGGGKIGGYVEGTYHNVFVDGGGFTFIDISGGINIQLGGGGGY